MKTKNSILHTILMAWRTYENLLKNYTNHPHSATFNHKNSVTFYYDGVKYKLTIEEVE